MKLAGVIVTVAVVGSIAGTAVAIGSGLVLLWVMRGRK